MTDNTIRDLEGLREIYPEPKGVPVTKQISALDVHCRTFIAASPFLLLGTQGDVSPKGDDPGFVHVADDNTLIIPDRKGNNRIDSLINIVENPEVGLLFLIPGVDETLRINGTAEVSVDPDILKQFELNGRPPATAIVVHVEEAFLHCAKALLRSHLWSAETQSLKEKLPPIGQVYADHARMDKAVETVSTEYQDHLVEDLAEEGRSV